MEIGENLRQILQGSSDLPKSASNKTQKPLPPGMGFDWKPSDKQTRRDIIQAEGRDSAIREAVKLQGTSLKGARKPVAESNEGGLWGRMGGGLKKLLEAAIPDAGAAEPNRIQRAVGMTEAPTGVSMNTQVQLNRLEEEDRPKEKPKPTVREDKGLSQKDEFKKVMGEDAAERKKAKQEADRKKLMKGH